MQDLAYKIDAAADEEISFRESVEGRDNADVCAACGEYLRDFVRDDCK